jgi:hypothetical protein
MVKNSTPNVLMMKATQDRYRDNAANDLVAPEVTRVGLAYPTI